MPENVVKSPASQGSLKERPLPWLLQQLFRKKLTGRLVVVDQTGDESDVYMRDGHVVHVGRPVDTDRLDNLLVEYGMVPAEIVARASQQVTPGMRLGEVLDRMGALDKTKLAQVLKSQVLRKLTRLFFVADGSFAVYLETHGYGEGDDLALMRVDPRAVVYTGIRAAYDLPRVTQELRRLIGQRFRLGQVSPGFVSALGIPTHDSTVEALRNGWLTLDVLDAITARPLEVRTIVLSLYYCDVLEREPIAVNASEPAVPQPTMAQSSDLGSAVRRMSDSGTTFAAIPDPAVQQAPAPASTASSAHELPPAPSRTQVAPRGLPPPQVAPAPVQIRPNVVGETVQAISASRLAAGGPSAKPAPAAQTSLAASSAAAQPGPSAKTSSGPATSSPQRAATASSPEALRAAITGMAEKLDRLTHFEALGVSQTASPDEVSMAFVRAARQFHPDRLASTGLQDLQPVAERILARINEASMVLGDAGRRADYLASLAAGPQATSATLPTVLEAENSFLKGEVFLKKGEHGKAIECFTKATQGNPSEPQYRAYLAWARFDDPRARKEAIVRETLKVMEGVLQERPRFSRGHFWVGLLWKFLNEPGRAGAAFQQAVAIDSSFIDASRELRLIEMRKAKAPAGKSEPPRAGGGGGLMGKLFKK